MQTQRNGTHKHKQSKPTNKLPKQSNQHTINVKKQNKPRQTPNTTNEQPKNIIKPKQTQATHNTCAKTTRTHETLAHTQNK